MAIPFLNGKAGMILHHIYQHFRAEEKDFIDQVLSWRQFVEDNYTGKLTDFLDPRQLFIVQSVIGKHEETKVKIFGGTDKAERKRAWIYPDYLEPTIADFQLTLLEVQYPSKFVRIEHRDVLGSLMSLGMKREKFGDILYHKERIQFFIGKEMQEYLCLQLNRIGNVKVTLIEKELEDAIRTTDKWETFTATTSSLRLDVILAAIFRISRQKTSIMIQQTQVKVNWHVVEQPAFECKEADIISVRGFGRGKIVEIDGKTKKDKWRLTVGKLK